jgi:hypothetical protein
LSAQPATAEAAAAVSTTCADVTTWAVTVNSTYYFVKSGGGWISSRGPDGSDQFGTVSLSVSQTSFYAVNPYLPGYNGYTAIFSGSVGAGCSVTGTWTANNLGQNGVFSAFPVSRSAPVIDSVEPAAGPLTGGNTVTITGSGFANPDLTFEGVVFDPTSDTSGDYSEGIDAPDVTVVSDTQIDVTAPDATVAAAGATSLETEVTAKFEVTGSPGEADDSVPAAQNDDSYVFGTTVGATISQVGISGSSTDPTLVVTGTGFGTAPATVAPCGTGGEDYSNGDLYLWDLTTDTSAGEPGDCIGLDVSLYTDTEIVFTFGAAYSGYPPLSAGDQFVMTVYGATFTGTAVYGTQTITFTAPATGSVGGSAPLSATGGASGQPVVFSVDPSTASGICNVSGTDGTTVNYTGAGSCIIDANQAAGGGYAAATQVTGTIAVVSLKSQTITFAKPANTTLAQSPVTVTATASSGLTVTFTTTTPTVAPTGPPSPCSRSGHAPFKPAKREAPSTAPPRQ